jgi:serine/threonine protein kinase
MEFVEGAPVKPAHNMRKLLDVAIQITDGLAAAHTPSSVHRDLRPENMLVTDDESVGG